MLLRILYQDQFIVAVDKPIGIEVHPREEMLGRARRTCMSVLRDQLGQQVFPAHRLDRATAGVLVFTLSSAAASKVQIQFQEHSTNKSYFCVVRGWTNGDFLIEEPLKNENEELLPAITKIQTLATIELPIPCGRYEKMRISLLRAEPKTGRFHQIRRHLAGLGYPILGDTRHGDKKLNRIFAQELGISRLLLHAHSLELNHPEDGRSLRFRSRWPHEWHKAFMAFGYCPLD